MNCGVDGVAQRPKRRLRSNKSWRSVQRPDIEEAPRAVLASLAKQEWLGALRVVKKIERAIGAAADRGKKVRLGIAGHLVEQNAQRVRGVISGDGGIPGRREFAVYFGQQICRVQLTQKLAGSVVGEA